MTRIGRSLGVVALGGLVALWGLENLERAGAMRARRSGYTLKWDVILRKAGPSIKRGAYRSREDREAVFKNREAGAPNP